MQNLASRAPPSVAETQEHADAQHPRREDGARFAVCGTRLGRHAPDCGAARNAVLCCGSRDPHSDLARLGAGVVLYFKWLKFLAWLFFALTLASGPQLLLNVASYGGSLATLLGLLEATAMSSLAAHDLTASPVGNVSSATGTHALAALLECGESCQEGRLRLAWLYSATELLVAAVFCVGVVYLGQAEQSEEAHIQAHAVTVEEYTVQFVNPPSESVEDEIKTFFEELTGEDVLEVTCAFNSGALIGLYMQRGKVINELWKRASRVDALRDKTHVRGNSEVVSLSAAFPHEEHRQVKGAASAPSYALSLSVEDAATRAAERLGLVQGPLERAVAEYEAVRARYEALEERLRATKRGNKVRAAFVTFATQAGYQHCCGLFGPGGARTADGKRVAFQGRRVRIESAPPPSTVLWENFDFSDGARRLRRAVTLAGALAVIAVSVALAYAASMGRQVLNGEIEGALCVLPANVTSLAELAALAADAARAGDAAGAERLRVLHLNCLCGLSTFSQALEAVFDASSACYPFWAGKAPLFGASFLVTVSVSVGNLAIRVVLTRFSEFEKHRSLVAMEKSLMQRVFWTLVLNTGFVVFVVNYDVRWLLALGTSSALVAHGYRDIVADWYSDVGVQILLVMALNALAPHAFVVAELAWVHCVRRNPRCSKPSSQRELNEWHTGPEFRANYRYAHNLMTAFVSMMYGPGLPLLYPLAAFSFALFYWVDKYLLLRYLRTPPRLDGKLAHTANALMLWAVVPNLGMAVWMYSAPGFFDLNGEQWQQQQQQQQQQHANSTRASYVGNAALGHGASEASSGTRELLQLVMTRAMLPFVAPLALAGLACCAALVLARLVPASARTRLCGRAVRPSASTAEARAGLAEAREEGLVHGIDSYWLLRNPAYAAAFGVDASFARAHARLDSMDALSAEQLPAPPLPASWLPAPRLPAPRLPAPRLPAPRLPALRLPALPPEA
jgi:hypothetical protein